MGALVSVYNLRLVGKNAKQIELAKVTIFTNACKIKRIQQLKCNETNLQFLIILTPDQASMLKKNVKS